MHDVLISVLVGNDSRKVVADGYPIENVIASDIQKGWSQGNSILSRPFYSIH